MQLVIGNKNYSSWSMRAWLLLRHFQVPFEEIKVSLFSDGYRDVLAKYSPTLRVPVLIDATETIWDSLAICEYVSEKYLAGGALPRDLELRARCRSYCSEMHSGFMAIRSELPMNCNARRKVEFSVEVVTECNRVDQLWSAASTMQSESGSYLFGDFSIADCMYAPMAMRFLTYGITLSAASNKYIETLQQNPAVKQWLKEAQKEKERLPEYEIGVDLTA